MSKVIALLNAAKTTLKVSSNYGLAKKMGIREQDISHLYAGRRKPSEEHLARLALVLGRPFGEVLAEVRSEDARTEKARDFWRSFLSATRAAGRTILPAIWCASWVAVSMIGAGIEWHRMRRYVRCTRPDVSC